jgi:outer membrane protein
MKKLQLIVNVILILAIGGLYVLFLTGNKSSKGSRDDASDNAVSAGNDQIVFVQIDSVLAKYDMAIDLADELQKSFQSSDAEFASQQDAYQKQVNDYQDRYNKGLITRSEATNIEQQLYTRQQQLLQLQQSLSDDLTEKQNVMNRQLIDAIMQYLNENRTQYNYRYVLGTSFGGNILYAHDSLDITDDVIAGLNEEYHNKPKDK